MSMTATPQADVYICPKCHSNRVEIGYPHIECFARGWSKPLIDFPVNWDWHRHYCRESRLPDPGFCESPEHSMEELHGRLSHAE